MTLVVRLPTRALNRKDDLMTSSSTPAGLRPGDTVLFIGDSITDAGRDRSDDSDLGRGYAHLAAALLGASRPDLGLTFLNRGIGGDTTSMVLARWSSDAIDLSPTVVSIMIGINDTWRRFDSGTPTSIASYELSLRAMLSSARDDLGAHLVLIEPFSLPVNQEQCDWRDDLDPRIAVVRRLAGEFNATLVPVDGLLSAVAARDGAAVWAPDGVHPSLAGHALIAKAWIDAVN